MQLGLTTERLQSYRSAKWKNGFGKKLETNLDSMARDVLNVYLINC